MTASLFVVASKRARPGHFTPRPAPAPPSRRFERDMSDCADLRGPGGTAIHDVPPGFSNLSATSSTETATGRPKAASPEPERGRQMARSDLTRVLSREEERNMEHAKALERAIRDKLINPAHGDRDQ